MIKILVLVSIASAFGTLGGLPERFMSEELSSALFAISALLYLVGVLLAWDILKRAWKIKLLRQSDPLHSDPSVEREQLV